MGSQQSSTTIPNPTPQEQALLDLVSGTLIPSYMEQAGYTVTPTTVDFEDSDQYKSLMKQRKAAVAQGSATSERAGPLGSNIKIDPVAAIDAKIEAARKSFQPYTTYETEKKENPEIEYLKNKYGDDSKQVKAARATYDKSQVDSYKQQQEIYKTYMDKTQKYLNGDFTLTDKEQKNLQDSMSSVKASLDNIFKPTLEETTKAFGDFTKVAGENGMTVRDALGAVGAQIEKTGIDMKKALDNVVATRSELLKNGIADATGDITKNVSLQAAQSGRDPSDPEFQGDIQQLVAKQVKEGQLQLADLQSQGELNIAERTGAGYEGVAREQAANRLDVAKKESGILANVDPRVSGWIPNQLQIGQSGNQYANALEQQKLENAKVATSVPLSYAGYYQSDRHAQPTTTQSSDPFSNIMGTIVGGASAGANIYSGVAQGNYLNSLTNSPSATGGYDYGSADGYWSSPYQNPFKR